MPKLADVMAEINTKAAEVKGIWDQADRDLAEGKGDGSLDATLWQKVKDTNKEIERLENLAKDLQDQDAARKSAAERGRLGTPRPDILSGQQPGHKGGGPGAFKTLGQMVTEDPAMAKWINEIIPTIPQSAKFGSSPAVKIPGGWKTLITGGSATSAGALVDPQFLGLQDMGAIWRELTIRDIITIGTTDSDSVEYVRQTSFTNNADSVAEASATSGVTGTKPESALGLEIVTEAVRTIAHWIPITRRALADAGQIRTYVESDLRKGLDEEVEDQVLTGDGLNDHLTGITNTTGTQSQAYDTSLLITTRRARTKVKTVGKANPTAYVMNPNDWEDMDLLQDAEERYYFGGPSVLGNPRLWGLPVVESQGMTEGIAVVGDWKKAILWDRQQAQILASDSHLDFFIRNIVALLAELRVAFTVLRPAAFVEIDMTP